MDLGLLQYKIGASEILDILFVMTTIHMGIKQKKIKLNSNFQAQRVSQSCIKSTFKLKKSDNWFLNVALKKIKEL